ncbi:hypothetical protein [Bradyrhizobium sp. CCBAU 11434]|uniref:hypothetical protein n=1 Tax=Bradyrhizobium sp. CCBAU 11434 TaxID=1630885 RepID=UPI002305B7F8|nr:hypothetical protein [Bradyrhizobium sp. CCBAU 11434]
MPEPKLPPAHLLFQKPQHRDMRRGKDGDVEEWIDAEEPQALGSATFPRRIDGQSNQSSEPQREYRAEADRTARRSSQTYDRSK